jgi:hypothetical protein
MSRRLKEARALSACNCRASSRLAKYRLVSIDGSMSRSRNLNDGSTTTTVEVYRAWNELRAHPLLLWVPPAWRATSDGVDEQAVMRRHAVPAIEQNLLVDVVPGPEGTALVRLATGPLRDRQTALCVDPIGAVGGLDPKLDVTAGSFGEAVIQLRNALFGAYPQPVPRHDPEMSAFKGSGEWDPVVVAL